MSEWLTKKPATQRVTQKQILVDKISAESHPVSFVDEIVIR